MSLSADGNTAIVGGDGDNNYSGAVWVWARSEGVWTQQGTKLVGSGAAQFAAQGSSVSLSADGNTAIVGGNVETWVWTRSGGVWTQQTKLVGSGGSSASLSGDGNTAIVGWSGDNGGTGAVWVWTRSGGVWTQQPTKLVGSGAVGNAAQGFSVSLSADGNTAIVGGINDNAEPGAACCSRGASGAAWIWTRSGAAWIQEAKLVSPSRAGLAQQGYSVSLSADGNTAIVGGPNDNYRTGAAWVWIRSGGVWTQQGPKLVGTGPGAALQQGYSVALSADGNTAIIGGPGGYFDGAAYIWTRSGGIWTQQGNPLVGSGAVGFASQGISVSISSDGNTAIVGGYSDGGGSRTNGLYIGAAWVWTRMNGVWIQQGPKLVAPDAIQGTYGSYQGASVALSADGNTAIVGGHEDNTQVGAVWIWTRSGGVWTQQGPKLVGSVVQAFEGQGISVALSGDGNTAIVGAAARGSGAWVWTRSGGFWTQQGNPLVGSGGFTGQGNSVSLSADGNTAIVGGFPPYQGNTGAALVWTRSGGVWTQKGAPLVGSGAEGGADQAFSVAISADGHTAIIGGGTDNGGAGAAWVFVEPGPPRRRAVRR